MSWRAPCSCDGVSRRKRAPSPLYHTHRGNNTDSTVWGCLMIHIFGPPTPKETMDKPFIQSMHQGTESTPLSIVFVPEGFRTICLWTARSMTTNVSGCPNGLSLKASKAPVISTRNGVFQGKPVGLGLGRDHEPHYGRPFTVRSAVESGSWQARGVLAVTGSIHAVYTLKNRQGMSCARNNEPLGSLRDEIRGSI